MKKIYLDYSATTPVNPDVVEKMNPYFSQIYGNASSIHSFGQEAKKALEDAREKIADLLNASKPEEIVFTSGGSEANNTALKGIAMSNRKNGNHIITSKIEHHSVLYTCKFLESEGFNVTYLPVDEFGRIDLEDLKKAITPQTILASIMHANNEIGTIEPITEIGKIIADENLKRKTEKKNKIYFHSDTVQTSGKLQLDVQELGIDFLSISAHKFYGPKGVGALYVKQGTRFTKLLHGGHQERNLRAGTENVAGIVGMAYAFESALSKHKEEQERLSKLRDRLEKEIIEKIPAVTINGYKDNRVANISSISFQGIEGESIMLYLDKEGIAVSTGSACASGSLETSHVLKALGVKPEIAQGTIRFSLGCNTTDEDIDYVIKILPDVITRLRTMSPLWKA